MRRNAASVDLKLMTREPILILFMLIPLLIMTVFKLMIIYLLPIITKLAGFAFEGYYGYILTFFFIVAPGMVGTAAGFLMIDERDNRIYELMSVTPIGRAGYISNRLMLPLTASIVYAILGYFVLDIYSISFQILFYIGVLTGIEGILVSLMLFAFAEDKVQGLTYSKALSIFSVSIFADMIRLRWVSILAALCPYYWIVQLVYHPGNIPAVISAAAVHILWLAITLTKLKNS